MSTLVRDNAVRFPDEIELEDADTGATRTWSQFDACVGAVLQEPLGLRPGDRVAFFAGDTADTFAVLFAGMR